MTFRAPKTANYIGKDIRTCPIFVEEQTGIDLVSFFEAVPMDGEFLLPTLATWADPGQRFTKVVEQAINDAGLERWPKLFVNCRGSRATEISRIYGPKNEAEWVGHSEEVSMRHYQMQMPGDWQRATGRRSTVLAL